MGIQRKFTPSFQSGELNEDFLRRTDDANVQTGCKRFRNAILNSGGGWERRPGTAWLADITQSDRLYRFDGPAAVEDMVFAAGTVKVYSDAGSLLQTLSSCPWVSGDMANLQLTAAEDQVFVFAQDMVPQILTRSSAGTWSRAAWAFTDGFGGALNQPYYRFAAPSITMDVSAYTGSGVTVTFSSAVLDTSATSLHIGARFRYLGSSEVQITAVASATSATADIIQRLYPSITLTVTATEQLGFKLGQVITGDTSGLSARVVSFPSGTTMRVIMLDGHDIWFVDTGPAIEKIVGPEGTCLPSVQATEGTPDATTIWDEQLMSDARGYPGAGMIHRDRLFLSRFAGARSLVAASTLEVYTDFLVGAEPNNAIQVSLGDDPNAEVRHLLSAEQLLLFTDRGSYYVPEGGDNPITPSSIAFLNIGPEGIAEVAPTLATEGALFIDKGTGRLMIVVPTGNIRSSWQVIELSESAFHLLTGPKRLIIANGLDGRTERYVMVLNTDGTIAVAMYRRGAEKIGFGLWSKGSGTWDDIAVNEDDVRLLSTDGTTYRLSAMSHTSLVDDEQIHLIAITARNGLTSHAVENKQVIESGVVAAGVLPLTVPGINLTIGADFKVEVTPAPPTIQELGYRRLRIPRYWVEVLSSGAVRVEGELHSPFLGGDDLEVVGKLRTRIAEGYTMGWGDEPTISITQEIGEGACLDVRALTYEVAF